jgi:uncharacterized integral membrane protein
MKAKLITLLLVGSIVSAAIALFVIQNLSRTTQLSFDLGFWAVHLQQELPVPALMGICLGTGLAVGLAGLTPRLLRLGSKVRQLERQVALSDQSGAEWPT